MFFKREREQPARGEQPDGSHGEDGDGALTPASPPPALTAAELRRAVDPATLGFKDTSELIPVDGLIGQDRALKAIEFGTAMHAPDYNLFVLGPPSTGKRTAVKAHLSKRARVGTRNCDWVYVHNFDVPNRPRALPLPRGRGMQLRTLMVAAIDELRNGARTLFEGEEFQARRRAIDEEFRSAQEGALEALNTRAQAQNIAILRTPMGFTMAPVSEGKVIKPETFNALPEDMRKGVEAKIEALQKDLQSILEESPKADKQRRARLAQLVEDLARIAVREALEDVRAVFADLADVTTHLDAVARDLVRNIAVFISTGDDEGEIVKQPVDSARDPRFRRYMVNVVIGGAPDDPQPRPDGGDGAGEPDAGTGPPAIEGAAAQEMAAATSGTPVVEETNPVHANIVGRIEAIAAVGGGAGMGTVLTDHLLIKPGALHRANGGTLLIDARQILLSPFSWEALKRALRSREIRIEHPVESAGLISIQSLEPEPIPLDVKVVLFGERQLYYLLAEHDPDFNLLFKVQADFDDSIGYTEENAREYARLVASVVALHDLRPVAAAGVARLIEEGSRLADDREKLSIEIGRLADIIREADHWRASAGHEVTTREDIERAIEEGVQRADRVRDRAQEGIARDIVKIDTSGAKIGQINALSVLQIGGFRFGRPSRVTARVRMGAGRVTDIEREVNLGGPLHSKGVMILWGYLATRYALDKPLALAATLVFEQSYGGVDGDSASSTELYALLSALAEVPIRQGIAVTGSVNQLGEVQAIGGANEKIEGFFDVCKTRGLAPGNGVMIPRANMQHLILREDVVAAAREGRFSVWAVDTIDQGIEILTGVAAGARRADGSFEPGSINARVEARLARFASKARAFAKAGGMEDERDGRGRPNGTGAWWSLWRQMAAGRR